MTLAIPFSAAEVPRWGACYTDVHLDDEPIRAGHSARSRGWLTRDEFLCIARDWKNKQFKRFVATHLEANPPEEIRACTRRALVADDPLRCVRLLSDLKGVKCRTASAVLHLCHPQPFPLLDVKSLAAVGVPLRESERWGEQDWLDVWPEYVELCRNFAATAGISMRELDRALWGYGDAHG